MYKIAFILLTLLLFQRQFGFAEEYYIDPINGNDGNIGSKGSPLATLSKAIEFVNELNGSGSIALKLFPGIHQLNDKILINPKRDLRGDERLVIEALVMPDSKDWTPNQTPIIQSNSSNNSTTQFPHSTGFLVAANNVTIRGLKFLGNPNPEVAYYYPISKEDPTIMGMEVSQCYFIAEKNSSPIQGAIWAHGPNTNISHCIFYNCRNAVLLFNSVEGFSITNSIIYGATESAIWMGPIDSDFVFKNNIVTRCNYFWLRPENSEPNYHFSDCFITENDHYTGFYTSQGPVETSGNKNFDERNIVKSGRIELVEITSANTPNDYLHLKTGSLGFNLNAGIFKNTPE